MQYVNFYKRQLWFLALSFLLLTSCSVEDAPVYLPIQVNYSTASGYEAVMTIDYDQKNRISQTTFMYNGVVDRVFLTYNDDDTLKSYQIKDNYYGMEYSNGHLSKIFAISPIDSNNWSKNVNYKPGEYSYGEMIYQLDGKDNITWFNGSSIAYGSADGPFADANIDVSVKIAYPPEYFVGLLYMCGKEITSHETYDLSIEKDESGRITKQHLIPKGFSNGITYSFIYGVF